MSEVRIAPLARGHRLDALDSGAEDLDEWLRRFARTADAAGTARTMCWSRWTASSATTPWPLAHCSGGATAFYERLGFVRSPTDPLHLMVLIKELRRTFG